MPKITLVKTPTELRGLSDEDDSAWTKFRARIKKLEDGELVSFEYSVERNSQFHRKVLMLFRVGFDAWEPDRKRYSYRGKPIQKNFESFRAEITILAGYYDLTFDLKGRMSMKPKSISYAKMDQDTFEKLYSAVAQTLLTHVLHNYTRDDLDSVVERLLQFT